MSLIEQANQRLEELQRAGVELPGLVVGPHMTTPRLDAPATRAAPLRAVTLPVVPAFEAPIRPRHTVTLDLERLQRIGYLVPPNTRSELAEEMRHLKRPLLRHARAADTVARRSALIMVTSALPGEGKTFSAINLALSIAMEVDTAVLLVDADVVRGDLPRRLGFAAERGLLDLLADPGLALADVVLATNFAKLTLLPCGASTQGHTELLASEAMGTLLARLAAGGPRQIVVFDGPPLLATNEAKVLATRVGQVLLVVAAASTPRSAVAMALAELEPCPLVMAIINKAAQPDVPSGYGYGYGA